VDWTMVRKVFTVALIVCGVGLASQAAALDQTSSEFLGLYTPPEPASVANEVLYINTLLDQASPSGPTLINLGLNGDPYSFTRSANDCGGPCDPAVAAGAVRQDVPPGTNTVDVTGFEYLIGKYDGPNGGSLVFFVGDLTGDQTLPTGQFGKDNSQYGLSHWTLFNPGTTTVPEPATLLLVGTGLVAVGLWRRKR
jgi:PEP-CTERM motif